MASNQLKKEMKMMTYKNIFRTMLLACAVVALSTSCKFEQDDLFDESASLRLTHQNDNVKARLVAESDASKNGWLIQYFVAGTDDYQFEGFNLFGRFYANGKVTLASDHRYLRNGNANKYTEHTSTYNMLSEEGTVLSFDTWNDILTVFADPVDPTKAPGSLVSNGEGMYGDHNLVLKKFSDNEILFYGERHTAITRMIPCDRPWQQYIADTKALKNRISSTSLNNYYVICGSDTMYFVGLSKGLYVYSERIVDPLNKKQLSCVFTPRGFRNENAETIKGVSFQEFSIDNDTTALYSEDGKVKVVACWDNYMANHAAIWELDSTIYTASQKAIASEINTMLKSFNTGWSLKSIGFGKSTGGNSVNGLVLTCYTNTGKTKTNTLGIETLVKRIAYGKLTVNTAADATTDKNMNTVAAKVPEFVSKVKEFANTLNGVYDVTPNDYFLPTGGTFTPVGGGTTFRMK